MNVCDDSRRVQAAGSVTPRDRLSLRVEGDFSAAFRDLAGRVLSRRNWRLLEQLGGGQTPESKARARRVAMRQGLQLALVAKGGLQ